ncbi:histidine kinase dimerization/phosphoacceptor domain -containing protein [Chelativorans sp.]|uniref:sensor histidine kinase n=1 Tax=Chelativorans sp. TaxID=2203393 RepID=UPI0028118C2E|nr:histidine kinase dimerization/phosphoacceptor domain -containing protein [Chelativorans sp.]
MRVLVIDDNPDDRFLAIREIRHEYPKAEFIEINSERAFAAALADGADVAVTDYQLGWTDGMSVFKRIRGSLPDCPVIMFTGTLGEEHAVDAIKAGISDYIIKDARRLPRLRAAVHSALKQVRERRERRRAEARHRDLFMNVQTGLFVCTQDGTFLDGNPALLAMLGLAEAEELLNLNLLVLTASEPARRAWSEMGKNGIRDMEVDLQMPAGGLRTVLLNARPASKEQEFPGVLGSITDLTELRNAVAQRDVLMREIFHRVHNSLQIVLSLVSQQIRAAHHPETSESLEQLGERIQALALIHRRLYESEDYTSVDFGEFLAHFAEARLQRRSDLALLLHSGPLKVAIERAAALGLAANEMLGLLRERTILDEGGRLKIALRREGRIAVFEMAADKGRAGAAKADPLRMRLLQALVKQVDGELHLSQQAELPEVALSFPINP